MNPALDPTLTDEQVQSLAGKFADAEAASTPLHLRRLVKASLAQGFLAGWYYTLTGRLPK